MSSDMLHKTAGAPTVILAVIVLIGLLAGLGYYFMRPSYHAMSGIPYYMKDPKTGALMVNPKFPMPPASVRDKRISGFDPSTGGAR
jgi:hypothetical protein